jgi:arylsulfatase A-like enzyme
MKDGNAKVRAMKSGSPGRRLRELLIATMTGVALLLPACSDPTPSVGSSLAFDRVVLVTLDTLRADHLSLLGYPRETAPFFTDLAARGTFFSNVMTSSSITAPSHSSILTGLYPYQHGVLDNGHDLDADRPNWVSGLSSHGYATGAFLSVHFLELLSPGFDHIEAMGRTGDETVDAALRWVEAQGDAPLFLWAHLFDLHEWIRFDTPSEYLERARSSQVAGEALSARIEELHLEPATAGPPPPGAHIEPSRDAVDHYDARILMLDDQLERLVHGIEAFGGRTLWIITSDHGEGMWSHRIVARARHVYEEQLRATLILYASDGSLAGPGIDELAHHVDLRPTLIELLGLPALAEPRAPGARSLARLLPGASRTSPNASDAGGHATAAGRILVAQRQPPRPRWIKENVYALRQGRLKYIRHSRGEDELYDLEADPLERQNLIGAPPPGSKGLVTRADELDRELRDPDDVPPVPEALHDELRALGYVE